MTLASTFQPLENFFYTFSRSSFTFRVITFPPSKQFEGISFTCLSKKKVTLKLCATKKKTNEKKPQTLPPSVAYWWSSCEASRLKHETRAAENNNKEKKTKTWLIGSAACVSSGLARMSVACAAVQFEWAVGMDWASRSRKCDLMARLISRSPSWALSPALEPWSSLAYSPVAARVNICVNTGLPFTHRHTPVNALMHKHNKDKLKPTNILYVNAHRVHTH